MTLLDPILQGIFLGAYYALIACGLSFLFGVMRIINLAHGTVAVLAAYLTYTIADHWQLSPFVALAVVVPVIAAAGWALQRTVLDRALRASELTPLLCTFGIAIVLDNTLFETFGATPKSLAPAIGDLSFASWTLPGGITVGQVAVLTLVVAVALLGGLQVLLSRTALGRAIRATAIDPDTAELVGIDARAIYAAAAAIAFGTVAVAGAFLGIRATFDPYAGPTQLIFAFEAVVIGGTGSLWGTLVGGIVLGVAQDLGAHVSPQGFLIAGHATFLLVLAVRFAFAGRDIRSLVPAPRKAAT